MSLVVVVTATGATVAAVAFMGGSSAGASVALQPAASAGTDPFTSSVAIGPVVEFPGKVRAITASLRKSLPTDPKTHTLVATGTVPGLYGGSGNRHLCDPRQLITFLDHHQDKASAWARVLGVTPSGIAAYVATLTPVVLTSDTLVTNHGYRNGAATSLESVLQAGTAVMVDSTGTPRVKCNCGNPLTPPEPITVANANIQGDSWPGYAPSAVTIVRAGPSATTLELVNITTGDNYDQPLGSAPVTPSTTTSTTTTAPTTSTTTTAPTTSTTTTAPTTSTTGAQRVPSITSTDFRNYTYEDRICGTHKPVHVTNGQWRQDPTSTVNFCGLVVSVAFADVTGDGVADAIVNGAGSPGGTALGAVQWTTVFAATATGPANLGYLDGMASPPYSAAQGIRVRMPQFGPNDPACCPSSFQVTSYKYVSGHLIKTGTTIAPPGQLPNP